MHKHLKKVLLTTVFAAFSGASHANITEVCQKYFDEFDVLVEHFAANATKKEHVDIIRFQVEANKKQFAELSESDQITACEQAIASMAQTKQAMGIQ
ncbi:DUF5339 domain-containing protein [Aeromonas enteropelogenes]|uniref:DUF5339 domain-containing protein n=1 Tax=Aeromonas enteropelogenes TaxID=29489 RepID=UPI003136FC24